MHRQYHFLGRSAVAKAMAGLALPEEKLYALRAIQFKLLKGNYIR
jgi:hypothetical protein